MSVRADQVGALHAYLTGDLERYQQAFGRLDSEAAQTGFVEIVGVAFFLASARRFGKDGTLADVIRFVSGVRRQSAELVREVDPATAVSLLRAVHTDEDLERYDAGTILTIQMRLLAAMVAEGWPSASELDELLSEVWELASPTSEEIVP